MKLTKSIDISHNMYQKSNDVNYITTSFNNKYYKNLTRNNKNSSKEKKRKLFSHDSFNVTEYNNYTNYTHNLTLQKSKNDNKNEKKRNKSRNSKLAATKYIKPLFYILKNQIIPINKQFNVYRNEKYFINFNYNLFPSFRNCENFMIKTMQNSPKKNDVSIYLHYNHINQNKIKLKKKLNRSFDDKSKNIRINKYININRDENEILNPKVILIQKCYRSFISRYKFYRNLRDNNKKDKKYSNTLMKLIEDYFNKLKIFKKDKTHMKSRNENYFIRRYNGNNNLINRTSDNIKKLLIQSKNENFTIKSKPLKNKKKSINNNNINLIKKQKELLEKERDGFIKEKKLNETKLKDLMEENIKLKQKNILYEKNKSNFEKLKEENENLKQKLNKLEERNKDYDIIENRCKNLTDQNEALFQENLKLNEQIEHKIKDLIEVNKKNQEKIKLYENSMIQQDSIINENQRLNILNNEMKNKMNQLIEEYNKLKETVKENEVVSKNNLNDKQEEINNKDSNIIKIIKEKEKLISENKKINAKNEELQNLLDEMKKKVSKLIKANKFANKFVNDNSSNYSREKSNINSPPEINQESSNKINEDIKEGNNFEFFLNYHRDKKHLSPKELKKEEKLKNVINYQAKKLNDYLHACFMKFYYNGIFVQIQKRKSHNDPIKVVKSQRFSALINKFNNGLNNKDEDKIEMKNIKKGKTKSVDFSRNQNFVNKKIIEEVNEE